MGQAYMRIDKEGRLMPAGAEDNSLFAALRPLIRTMPDSGCTNTSGCNCSPNPLAQCNSSAE